MGRVGCAQRPEQAPRQFSGDLEVASQLLQILIEPTGEGEQIVPLILQGAADRPQAIGALSRAGLQLCHHKVVEHAAIGVARPGDSENVIAQPIHQQSHFVSQCHSFIAGRACSAQQLPRALCRLGTATPVVSLLAVSLSLAVVAGLQSPIRAVLQIAGQELQIAKDVENVASTGNLRKGQSLTGTQPATRISNGGLGIETLIDQIEQTNAPGVGVAMLLQTEQVAIGRGRVDTDEDRLAGLEDFVMSADADTSQIAPAVDLARRFDGAMHDVVHRAQGDGVVKEVADQLDDGPVGAVADQHLPKDQLLQPGLAHGQVEENFIIGRFGVERAGQSFLGGVGLLIEELPADLMVTSQVGNWLSSSEYLDSQMPPLLR